LRIDESLYFANAQIIEEKVEALIQSNTDIRTVLMILSAVNQLDSTALAILTDMQKDLAARHITLQFAEIKGPVLDRLRSTPLGQTMRDQIFLSTHEAFTVHALQRSTAKKNSSPV